MARYLTALASKRYYKLSVKTIESTESSRTEVNVNHIDLIILSMCWYLVALSTWSFYWRVKFTGYNSIHE